VVGREDLKKGDQGLSRGTQHGALLLFPCSSKRSPLTRVLAERIQIRSHRKMEKLLTSDGAETAK